MANPTVDKILNMKSYELKEFLQDHHVPVPKRQSKEFLQTVALQTHADLEAESSKRRIITRRRSKREETDLSSTYSGIYGRSSSMLRSSTSRNSPPRSLMTTRSRAQAYIQTDAESPDIRKQGEEVEKEQAAAEPAVREHLHDHEEGLSYSSYSSLLHAGTSSSPPLHILSSIDINQQADNAGEREAASPSSKQDDGDASHNESAEHPKLTIRAHQESPDKAVAQLESMKAIDNESSKKQSRPNQEVVKKIIRVNDEADHQERNKGNPWIKKPFPQFKEGHVKGHHGSDHGDQVSRMQRLKRSASMIMSQVNERVLKRLRKVPNCRLHLARPSPHASIALLMCAVCVAAIGAASYWYHLKKLEEQRAPKRWLW